MSGVGIVVEQSALVGGAEVVVSSVVDEPKCRRCGGSLERGRRGWPKYCERVECKRERWREQKALRDFARVKAKSAPVAEDVKPDTVPFEQS
jgi:hypothetical protein